MYNAGVLGPKGLAKKVAKDTGKVAVGVPEKVIRGQVRLEPSKEPPLLPQSDKATCNPSNPPPRPASPMQNLNQLGKSASGTEQPISMQTNSDKPSTNKKDKK